MKLSAVILFTFSFILVGCDNPITCNDPCPNPKESRDFFCGCFDPDKKTSGNNKTKRPPSNSAFAQCICQYKNGLIGAWFNYRPSIYDKFNTLEISASTCTDLTVCERIRDADGGDSYTYLTGKIRLDPSNWQRNDNFVNGRTSYAVFGSLKNKVSDGTNIISYPTGPHLALLYKRFLRSVQLISFQNTAQACMSACATGSPFCLSYDLKGEEAQGLIKLYSALSKRPKYIKASTLRGMFGVRNDPCARSDTVFSEDGKLENTGDACTLTSNFPELSMSATIDVPTNLFGDFNYGPKATVLLSLNDPERRPRLSFSDKYIDADWGGAIKTVFGDAKSIGFAVGENSCVLARLP